jgi:hypothetical protein
VHVVPFPPFGTHVWEVVLHQWVESQSVSLLQLVRHWVPAELQT